MLDLLFAISALLLPQADQRTARDINQQLPDTTEEETTVAAVRVKTDPDGEVTACTVLRFVGTEQTATRICRAAVGSRFKPARDSDGNKVGGTITFFISAYPRGGQHIVAALRKEMGPERLPINATLFVDTMPEQLVADPRIGLRVLIDQNGNIEHCEGADESELPYIEASCGALADVAFESRTDKRGRPIRYIVSQVVTFEAALQEPPPGEL